MFFHNRYGSDGVVFLQGVFWHVIRIILIYFFDSLYRLCYRSFVFTAAKSSKYASIGIVVAVLFLRGAVTMRFLFCDVIRVTLTYFF